MIKTKKKQYDEVIEIHISSEWSSESGGGDSRLRLSSDAGGAALQFEESELGKMKEIVNEFEFIFTIGLSGDVTLSAPTLKLGFCRALSRKRVVAEAAQ